MNSFSFALVKGGQSWSALTANILADIYQLSLVAALLFVVIGLASLLYWTVNLKDTVGSV